MRAAGGRVSLRRPDPAILRCTCDIRTLRSVRSTIGMAEASAGKKRKVVSEGSQPQPCNGFSVPGLTLQDFRFKAPLDYFSDSTTHIDIFVRFVEGTNKLHTKQPYLLYLQGGRH